MATKTVSVPSKKETSRPITLITQKELKEYKLLEKEIEKLKEDYDLRATNLKDLLAANVKVEEGFFSAEISTTFRRNPKWKEEAIALADQIQGAGKGEIWAAGIINATEQSTSVRLIVK